MRASVLVRAVTALLLLAPLPVSAAESQPAQRVAARAPLYAYFYQWFDHGSWDRAKRDLPLAGTYSSSDPAVLRTQLRQMRAAGVTGVLTSWKSTPRLDERLELLLTEAARQDLQVGIVYQALDFSRRPLPVARIRADLLHLVARWGTRLGARDFGRPLVVWTGTEQYPVAEVHGVHDALAGRVRLLAAAKQVSGYERLAGAVDGEAYYWSSADPSSGATVRKLQAMSRAVHARHGLWLAPASPGYDGRALGGTRVVDRDGGRTLVRSLDNAYSSAPDAVGLISWNEWSEATNVEPSQGSGDRELQALTRYVRSAPAATGVGVDRRRLLGALAVPAVVGLVLGGLVSVLARRRRSVGLDEPVPHGVRGGLQA